IAEKLYRVRRKLPQVSPRVRHRLYEAQGLGKVLAGDRLSERLEPLPLDDAQDLGGEALGDLAVGEGDTLVEIPEGVAHAARRMGRNQPKGSPVDADALLFGDPPDLLRDFPGREGPKVELLAPGQDRRGNAVRLRGGEDEHHMPRGLLKHLEKGV